MTMDEHDQTPDPYPALWEMYEEVVNNPDQADPYRILHTFDEDDGLRFSLAWWTVTYAVSDIVAGPVRKGRSSGAISVVTLAGIVRDSYVAADGNERNFRESYAWVNRQLRYAIKPSTFVRIHGVEEAARLTVDCVSDLQTLFREQTVSALRSVAEEILEIH
jgi:hypothetical protein